MFIKLIGVVNNPSKEGKLNFVLWRSSEDFKFGFIMS